MKNYIKPDITLIKLSASDLIITSGGIDLPEAPFGEW